MIRSTEQIELNVAQTDNVCIVEAVWRSNGMARWSFDGSSKRSQGDLRNYLKGRDLATLRALRQMVRCLEDHLGPDAFSAPKELPSVVVTITADTSGFREALAKIQTDVAGTPAAVDALKANRCPGHSVTPEELAEAFQNDAATCAGKNYRPWRDMTPDARRTWIEVSSRMLARFFPEHIAGPAAPAVERCGRSYWRDLTCVRPRGHAVSDGAGCSSTWRPEDGPEPIAETEES